MFIYICRYFVELKLKQCPKNKTVRKTEIDIRPSTSSSESGNSMKVEIDMICDCGCENETSNQPVS